MSAYLVDRQTIDLLVSAAVCYELVERSASDETGRLLWTANLEGVAYRYPADRSGERPEPIGLTDDEIRSYVASPSLGVVDPQATIDACDELRYQACESPNWGGSRAEFLLDALYGYATAHLVEIEREAAKIAQAERTLVAVQRFTVKETAAEMRKALKAAWPGVKFSVRMARGTGYGWLDVTWVDGPTETQVREITSGFESSRFDGMDDSYHSVEPSLYMSAAGEMVELRYSCCGVVGQRTLSPEALERAETVAVRGTEWWPIGADFETWSSQPAKIAAQRMLHNLDLTTQVAS